MWPWHVCSISFLASEGVGTVTYEGGDWKWEGIQTTLIGVLFHGTFEGYVQRFNVHKV